MFDFQIKDKGKLFMVTPLTERAIEFASKMQIEEYQRLGASFCVEAHLVNALITNLEAERFNLEIC